MRTRSPAQLGSIAAVLAVALSACCAGPTAPDPATSGSRVRSGRSPARAVPGRLEVQVGFPAERYWRATSPELGALAYPRDFSVFVFGDLAGQPAAEGPVAAGGSVELAGATVNTMALGVGVVAGRDVSASGGSIAGAIVHGRIAVLSGAVAAEGALVRATPIDFDWAQAELTALSDALGARPATGSTLVRSWGGITFSGADPQVNVFEVSGEALRRAPTVEVATPPGAVAIVNVRGARAAVVRCGLTLSGGADSSHLLWNLPDAAALVVRSSTVPGTILAPRAAMVLSHAAVQGTVVAASLSGGSSALRFHPFVGFGGLRPAGARTAVSLSLR